MFGSTKEFVAYLRSENAYLRAEITSKEKMIAQLTERFASLNETAFWAFKNGESASTVNTPKWIDPMGMIQSMDATTPEEIKDKEAAIGQVRQMFGGG